MLAMITAARAAHSRRQQDYQTACELIYRLNTEHGYSFYQLGDLLGMSHSTAHHMAKQHESPPTRRPGRRSQK